MLTKFLLMKKCLRSGSGLLSISNTATTFTIIGCITTIGIVVLLDYMRDKVGLKPEEYSKEDIRYSINKPELK